jgi:thiamine kinase-like enzyme
MSLVDESTQESAKNLLKEAGFKSNIKAIDPIHQGGNNQLYRVKNGAQDFVLKKYFQHPEDKRNRLAAEFSFLEFAHKTTPQFVPKPFAKNDTEFTALYEFVDGIKIRSEQDLKNHHIATCGEFISLLNQSSKHNAISLMNASEACFSIKDHLNTIDKRIGELVTNSSPDNQLNIVLNMIQDQWFSIKEKALNECDALQISVEAILPLEKRVISPSDFGFHNTIMQNNGMIKFIDFEYAGWDDPAKLVGDFFGQVAIPVGADYLDDFIGSCFKQPSFTELDANRIYLLIDSYKIKWCCIVLNIFLSKNLNRRLFSNPNLDVDALKSSQLNKATKILESLT